MPVIKHYYGDMPFWRAEVSRLALHLGNVPFEDLRAKSPEDWKEFKAKGPFGQVPVLEVDGKAISQTGAIARYCGKQGGLYPRDDDFAAAKIDEIIDTATDMTVAVGKSMGMKDEAEKMAARAVLAETTLPKYLTALEKIITDNGSTGFYVGSKMTIADIAMWRMLGWFKGGVLDGIPSTIIDSYPLVLESWTKTETHPQIAAWMAQHYPKK